VAFRSVEKDDVVIRCKADQFVCTNPESIFSDSAKSESYRSKVMSSIPLQKSEFNNPLSSMNFTPWRAMSRLPSILQNETGECGLACLAMISGYFGARMDLSAVREKAGFVMTGMTLKDIMVGATRIGMTSRAIRAEIGSIGNLRTPCILHWDMNHFVVLKKVGKRKIVVHDPRIGVVEYSIDEFSEYFTGMAVECVPNETFEKKDQTQIPTLRSLVGETRGLYGALLQIFALAMVLQLIGLLSPAAMQWLIDSGLQSADDNLIVTIVAGLALMLLVNILIGTARSWMVMYLTINVGYRWSSRVLHHLLHLPLEYFEKRHLGDILSRFSSVGSIQGTITTGVIEGILDGMLAICFLAMIWNFSATLAATAIAGMLLLVALQLASFGISKRISNEAIVADARVSSNIMETLRGIRAIKLCGRTEHRLNHWQNMTVDSINIRVRQQWLGIVIGSAGALISGANIGDLSGGKDDLRGFFHGGHAFRLSCVSGSVRIPRRKPRRPLFRLQDASPSLRTPRGYCADQT
jgi:ATP-binding cassette, subfamily B, bacterial CvaB/MchF/RaxB